VAPAKSCACQHISYGLHGMEQHGAVCGCTCGLHFKDESSAALAPTWECLHAGPFTRWSKSKIGLEDRLGSDRSRELKQQMLGLIPTQTSIGN
jgi:hypothetical protein